MKKSLLIILLFIAMFAGCKKNDNDAPGDVIIPGGPVSTIRVSGIVTDELGNPLPGVTMKINTTVRVSNASGFFAFDNVMVSSQRYFVSAVKDGYFDGGFGGIPMNGMSHVARVSLISQGVGYTISSTSGGTYNMNLNSKIIFPSSAFITESGSPLVGNAVVHGRFISPDLTTNFELLFPGGDLANSDLTPLISYGMMAVSLRDAGGIPIKLAPGKTAEIYMPISPSQLGNAPATIPLLSFDPEKGTWQQEGNAVKTGSNYVGTVSHFSWWNCDAISGTPPTIIGKVVDCHGTPLPGVTVTVNSQYNTITNSQGIYTNWVPPGITITLEVLSGFNNGVYVSSQSTVINPVAGLNVVPDIVVPCPAFISGNIQNCDELPTPFYVWASWTGANTNAVFSSTGNFQIGVLPGQQVTLHFSTGSFMKDTVVTSGIIGSVENIGNFQLCNTSGVTTGCTGGLNSVTDIDGTNYSVVQIGNQCWFKENLKTSRYRNGDTIEYIPRGPIVPDSVWHAVTHGAYTSIDNAVYGKLYNFLAVADPRGLCPTGWHVADSSDFAELSMFLGGSGVAGGALKQTGTVQAGTGLWMQPNTGATNVSGFTGLPGGFRAGGTGGNGGVAFFWSSTPGNSTSAYERTLSQTAATFNGSYSTRTHGHSVRCIKD